MVQLKERQRVQYSQEILLEMKIENVKIYLYLRYFPILLYIFPFFISKFDSDF